MAVPSEPARHAGDLPAAPAEPPAGGRARADRRRVVDLRRPVGAAGFALGLPLAWLTHSIAMVPTLIVAGIALGVFVGGGFLRAQKRGRPDTWLYRQLQWRLACSTRRWRRSWAGSASSPVRAAGRPAQRRSRARHEPFQERGCAPAGAREDAAPGAGALFVVALLLGFGWWSAPKSLTIHVPPDLRSGSTRKWWDVPPECVCLHVYIWQQVQRWPTNGEGLSAQPARCRPT